jgi:hypothetical protein
MRQASQSRYTRLELQGRHFWWLADVISDIAKDREYSHWEIANIFARACAGSNSNFKWSYFLNACKAVEPKEKKSKRRRRIVPADPVKARMRGLEYGSEA